VVAIDRSAKAIAQARGLSDLAPAHLDFRCVAAEAFVLAPGEAPFDLGFAFRVGALDGRHPQAGLRARARLAAALKPGAAFLIDGGTPLRTLRLP
jgi:hypothetical protein